MPGIDAHLSRLARTSKDRTAVQLAVGARLSYGDWDRRAVLVACGLLARGVTPGTRVGVACGDWIEYAIAYAGVLRAGGVAVVLPCGYGVDVWRELVSRMGVVGVVGGADVGSSAVWVASVDELAVGQRAVWLPHAEAPTGVADIVFSAGTTGEPVAVVRRCSRLIARYSDVGPGGAQVAVMHAALPGTTVGHALLLDAMCGRRSMVVLRGLPAATEVARLIYSFHVKWLLLLAWQVGPLIGGVVSERVFDQIERVTIAGGAISPMQWGALERAFGSAALESCYATVQASPWAAVGVWDGRLPFVSLTPEGGGLVRVVDDGGESLVGMIGRVEVFVDGDTPGRHVGELSERGGFTPDGWVRTGDLGMVTPDGAVVLFDREADALACGDRVVSSWAVEAACAEVAGVSTVAVVTDGSGGCMVTVAGADGPDVDGVRSRAAEVCGVRLAAVRVVEVWSLVHRPQGQVDKGVLRGIALGTKGGAPVD